MVNDYADGKMWDTRLGADEGNIYIEVSFLFVRTWSSRNSLNRLSIIR